MLCAMYKRSLVEVCMLRALLFVLGLGVVPGLVHVLAADVAMRWQLRTPLSPCGKAIE